MCLRYKTQYMSVFVTLFHGTRLLVIINNCSMTPFKQYTHQNNLHNTTGPFLTGLIFIEYSVEGKCDMPFLQQALVCLIIFHTHWDSGNASHTFPVNGGYLLLHRHYKNKGTPKCGWILSNNTIIQSGKAQYLLLFKFLTFQITHRYQRFTNPIMN